jgi:hypothetical protein
VIVGLEDGHGSADCLPLPIPMVRSGGLSKARPMADIKLSPLIMDWTMSNSTWSTLPIRLSVLMSKICVSLCRVHR